MVKRKRTKKTLNMAELSLKEQIKDLETILNRYVISQKDRQILLKEIERLKQELVESEESKQ
jgi:hypothetical protein